MKPTVERVAEALRANGIEPQIVEFTESTRTAEEAAQAVGTRVECIVKSLVFVADERPVLALVSGGNRASLERLGAILQARVQRAGADLVRSATGFAIGGVPPLGHATVLPVLIDDDLLRYDLLYAAAGTPNAVFPITPQELVRVTGGQVVPLKQE